MRLTKLVSVVAAASMATVPALAAPGEHAAKLSLRDQMVRADAPMKDSSKARGTPFIIAGAVIALVVVGVVLASKKDNTPASP